MRKPRKNDQSAAPARSPNVKKVVDDGATLQIHGGPDAESGVGFVVGYARAKGLPVVGFRTDCRPSEEKGLNVMLNRGCNAVIHQPLFDNYYLVLAKDIARRLCPLLKVKLATRRQRQEHYVPWPSDRRLHTTESLLGYLYGALGKSPWLDVVRALAGEALQYRQHCAETDWVLHDKDGTGQALVRLSTFLDRIGARDLDDSCCRAAEKLIRTLRRRVRPKADLKHAAKRARKAGRELMTAHASKLQAARAVATAYRGGTS
ncbi:MAG: hypothetical protein NTW87_25050 [Planctomycetota bacterium]|nr:hypothetical protein [Planctomycetota bacterium]